MDRCRALVEGSGAIAIAPLLSGQVRAAGQRVACVLTGHLLKDPNVTVNYHKERQGAFSNPPVEAPNDLEKIIKLMPK